jgi:DNA-binding transcriptional LysR family regulator
METGMTTPIVDLVDTALVYAKNGSGEIPAQNMGVHPMTIYKRVKKLESYCGGNLFTPDPGGSSGKQRIPSLTERGKVFMSLAEEFLNEHDCAEEVISEAKAAVIRAKREEIDAIMSLKDIEKRFLETLKDCVNE